MNFKNSEDLQSSKTLDDVDTPRKRLRLEKMGRKSWSLTDRRTDQEVLEEMGVGLLDSDENELQSEIAVLTSPHKPNLKRKHNIENVNPNINSSITSPRNKHTPGSPRIKINSPDSEPTCKNPRSTEKNKPLQSIDQSTLETTLLEDYLIEEETPSTQSVSATYLPSNSDEYNVEKSISGGRKQTDYILTTKETHIVESHFKCDPEGVDSTSVLSDEMMLSVFKWLPKRTLAHCMLVCKRWYRVAGDETLWQRLDLGNKTLSKGALGRILDRKPIVVRLASSEIGEWHPNTPPISCRIQYLDLSMCNIDQTTLDSLLERCTVLKKLSLESVQIYDSTCEKIGKCHNMETLNLTMAVGITAEGLKSILVGCPSIQSLNISWCNLAEDALQVLVTKISPRVQRLNLGGARIMTDEMVIHLVDRCSRLLELDLSDCSRLGVDSVTSVMSLSRLEHLALSRCYLLPPRALTKLNAMPALQYLEVWGMLQSGSLNALKAALPAIQINQFMFNAIARPTVGTRRTSIWGLRTRD